MDSINKNKVFRDWVDQYYEYGFRIAYRIIGNKEDCRDIVQDAFLKIWIRFDEYNEKVKFSTWLFTIITNLCYDRLRKRKTAANYAESVAIRFHSQAESTEEILNDKELRTTINKLSENLSPKQKIVFVLRDLEELEIDEVCKITKMDREQIKANLYYARKRIRENLILRKLLEEKI